MFNAATVPQRRHSAACVCAVVDSSGPVDTLHACSFCTCMQVDAELEAQAILCAAVQVRQLKVGQPALQSLRRVGIVDEVRAHPGGCAGTNIRNLELNIQFYGQAPRPRLCPNALFVGYIDLYVYRLCEPTSVRCLRIGAH